MSTSSTIAFTSTRSRTSAVRSTWSASPRAISGTSDPRNDVASSTISAWDAFHCPSSTRAAPAAISPASFAKRGSMSQVTAGPTVSATCLAAPAAASAAVTAAPSPAPARVAAGSFGPVASSSSFGIVDRSASAKAVAPAANRPALTFMPCSSMAATCDPGAGGGCAVLVVVRLGVGRQRVLVAHVVVGPVLDLARPREPDDVVGLVGVIADRDVVHAHIMDRRRATGHPTWPAVASPMGGSVALRRRIAGTGRSAPRIGIERSGRRDVSMSTTLTRLTEPMVREHGELRVATWDEALDRAAEGLRRAADRNPGWGTGVFSCSKATNEMNFVAGKFAVRSSAATTSTAATAPDTRLRWSVWPPSSVPVAVPAHTRRSSTPTSSCCGARTLEPRTRSSSTTS